MRIHDHLLNVGAAALDLGALTAFLYGFYQRELIYDICETASGQRFHPSYTRVGGLMYDVSDTFVSKVRAFVRGFPKTHADITRLLTRNRIFMDRMQGIGVLAKEEAINLSCTGPIARASGVVRDVRKDEQYLAYKDFDFKVVCATAGDSYARFLVRMEEMLESVKIVEQAIENLPSGPVNVDSGAKVVLPDQLATYRSIESLIQHFELVMPNRGFQVPVDEIYAATESPNGELGFYIVSDGSERAYRARTRPPSYIHFAIFPYLIAGHQISDVVVVLGSLNIIAAELDR
jgi:NADH-quinone oxidoreductase subunit D